MTKLVADVRCDACGGFLVPPALVAGAPVRLDAAYVCIDCNRPYFWCGKPSRLTALSPKAITSSDD